MKGTNGEYELIVLHPNHFLIDNTAVLIKHPHTQNFTRFYASRFKDGFLHEGSPTGPPLPPFHSRGKIGHIVPLNPILVNYAAILRLRHLIHQNPSWGSTLSQRAIRVLRNIVSLHGAVIWTPDGSQDSQLKTTVLGSKPPLVHDLRGWPYHLVPREAPQPNSSSPGPNPEIKTGMPATALDRAFVLLEAGSS